MIKPSAIHVFLLISVIGPLLGACAVSNAARSALPNNPGPYSEEIAALKDSIDTMEGLGSVPSSTLAGQIDKNVGLSNAPDQPDATVEQYAINSVGFAQVENQPGTTVNQRRLMALRAARMEAMRGLAEQVHGLTLVGNTTVQDARVRSDTLTAIVDGTIRGARTVRISPKGSDGYEVELSLDADTVAYLVRAARGQI